MGFMSSSCIAISSFDGHLDRSNCFSSNCCSWTNRPPLPLPERSDHCVPVIVVVTLDSVLFNTVQRHEHCTHTWLPFAIWNRNPRSLTPIVVDVIIIFTFIDDFTLGH